MIGVCPAGLANTALPAASAAATCPVKIASGKFHGEMHANTPRPLRVSVLRSPVGPGSATGSGEQAARLRRVVAQEVDRLAYVSLRVLQRLAGFAHDHRHEACFVTLE